MLAENNIARLFSTCGCGPGLPKKTQKTTQKKQKTRVETLLYFKTELKLLGPICSWSHCENIALFCWNRIRTFCIDVTGSDEHQAKEGNLSPWVSSHPISFPLSSVFSCTYFHTHLIQVNLRHFAGEMKELGKNAQSKRFLTVSKSSFACKWQESTTSRILFY